MTDSGFTFDLGIAVGVLIIPALLLLAVGFARLLFGEAGPVELVEYLARAAARWCEDRRWNWIGRNVPRPVEQVRRPRRPVGSPPLPPAGAPSHHGARRG